MESRGDDTSVGSIYIVVVTIRFSSPGDLSSKTRWLTTKACPTSSFSACRSVYVRKEITHLYHYFWVATRCIIGMECCQNTFQQKGKIRHSRVMWHETQQARARSHRSLYSPKRQSRKVRVTNRLLSSAACAVVFLLVLSLFYDYGYILLFVVFFFLIWM